jgi:hypothetical protein
MNTVVSVFKALDEVFQDIFVCIIPGLDPVLDSASEGSFSLQRVLEMSILFCGTLHLRLD